MRRMLVLGAGLAGVLSGSAVTAQFAADRVPAAPQPKAAVPFGGAQPPAVPTAPVGGGQPVGTPASPTAPVSPGGYVPPVGAFSPAGGAVPSTGGFQPAGGVAAPTPPPTVEVPSALGPNHPLAVRPEHGAFFICVKSYARPSRPTDGGPTAREMAEALAAEIRETHRVNAVLFEHISEERKAEAAAIAAARQRASAFVGSVEAHRQKSQLNGMEFLEPDAKVRYKTVNYTDQIAVLVGGFKTDEDARKALDKVRAWPAPKNKVLMDGGAIVKPGSDGKPVIERSFINPFATAMVVPNPAAPRPAAGQPGMVAGGLDPFVVKLNDGRPYNLLKATKGWTLSVKAFTAPVQIQSKDAEPGVVQKMGSKGADVLAAGAEQAEALAKALRDPRMKPQPFEAFVLHTRSASYVTVGQFDGPNDPALAETRRVLMGLSFNLTEDERGMKAAGPAQKLFGDNILPVPVPRP